MEIPELTGMDQNGPEWTPEWTKTDRNGHRNGPEWTPESTKTDRNGHWNRPERTGMDTRMDLNEPEWTHGTGIDRKGP